MTHLFVLEKAGYTYKNAVTPYKEQPTHLRVICSVPYPLWIDFKPKFAQNQRFFHNVLCLERSERNDYKNEKLLFK